MMNFDVSVLDKLPELVKGIGGFIKGIVGITGTYQSLVLIVGALLAGWFLAKTYVPNKFGSTLLYAGIIYLVVAMS